MLLQAKPLITTDRLIKIEDIVYQGIIGVEDMTEACKAFIKYIFDHGFHKIVIEADVNNIGSNRVIEKCGFTFTHKEYKEHRSNH